MACCCAMRARWANSARCRWYRDTFAARPTPCRYWLKSSTMNIKSCRCSRLHRFWQCWHLSHCWRKRFSSGIWTKGNTRVTIEVRNIVKKFGAFAALDRVDLKVANGELLALLGPSGSGKTTLLRIIAGLDWPDSGEVTIDGEDALAPGARGRHVGFVFQHYALFRHMTVFENVAFGLRVQPRAIRKDEARLRARVKELLDLVQLDWLASRYPSQLSGRPRPRI